MNVRIFMTVSWVIVLALYAVGVVILLTTSRTSGIPAPPGIVEGGACVMFAATLGFALIFAHTAMITQE